MSLFMCCKVFDNEKENVKVLKYETQGADEKKPIPEDRTILIEAELITTEASENAIHPLKQTISEKKTVLAEAEPNSTETNENLTHPVELQISKDNIISSEAEFSVKEVNDTEIHTAEDNIMSQVQITKPAPEFSAQAVVDGDFQTVKLSQYRGKYVVLFFYPLDFTFVCPTEIRAFSDRVEEFRNINCEVLACSTDSVFSHLAWVNTPPKQGGLGAMNIPLIADKTLEISRMYGCLKEDEGIAFRGLFIIDDKGNLRQMTINDLPVGRSVDETLRLVQAFQFTDKHGEVCPVGWKPGADTIKPDPKGSKKFFNKVN